VTGVGILVMLLGIIPIALSLSVSNALIDDNGIEPGEMEIMDAWEAWAFSPKFILCALAGVGILFIQFCLCSSTGKRCYAVTVLLLSVVSVFVAILVHGWYIF
jgi:hypothetical protein